MQEVAYVALAVFTGLGVFAISGWLTNAAQDREAKIQMNRDQIALDRERARSHGL